MKLSTKPCVKLLYPDGRELTLSARQLSLAWAWLVNPLNPTPPRGVRHLSKQEWLAVEDLLEENLRELEHSHVH